MIRTVIGGLVAGIILFLVGYVFWATPLGDIPFSRAGDAESAAVQTALAQNLTRKDTETGKISGTGTYIIPDYHSAQGAVLYGKGPIATIHYNTNGFSRDDMSMILPGFIAALISGLLMAFGLAAVGSDFAGSARLVVLMSLAFTSWTLLASPIFNHYDWGYWIYYFITQSVALIAAGLVVARWFVPLRRTESAEAPRPTEA
jgi:hypothetical protein